MPKIRIPNNWVPRPDQLPLWTYLEDGGLRAVEIAHRRWGKDDIALHFAATQAMQRVGNYWHMLPMYNQARKAIWDAVNPKTGKRRIDEAFPREIRRKTRETDMFIEFRTGATWQLVGSDNFNAYVGSPPIGVTFSEWALANPMCWPYIMPILEENQGWALFITTSRGNNHAKDMLAFANATDSWFGEVTPASRTPVFNQDTLDRIRAELIAIWGPDQGEALYQQEYHCSFEGSVFGAYFAAQLRMARDSGRITKVPYQSGVAVDTWWDLGMDDSTTIWFTQDVGREIHAIGYYENSGEGLEHYAGELKRREAATGCVYGRHVGPHDITVREIGPGKSRLETAKNLGIKFDVCQRPAHKEDGIQAIRNIMSSVYFDEVACAQGLNCLSNYRKEYDQERKVFKDTPVHDWSSHGTDGFQTLALAHKWAEAKKKARMPQQTFGSTGWMAA